MPLEGPKGKGSLFLHVNCEDGNFYSKDGCVLRRAECDVLETSALSEDKYKEKRLLIYDLNKHGPTDQNQWQCTKMNQLSNPVSYGLVLLKIEAKTVPINDKFFQPYGTPDNIDNIKIN